LQEKLFPPRACWRWVLVLRIASAELSKIFVLVGNPCRYGVGLLRGFVRQGYTDTHTVLSLSGRGHEHRERVATLPPRLLAWGKRKRDAPGIRYHTRAAIQAFPVLCPDLTSGMEKAKQNPLLRILSVSLTTEGFGTFVHSAARCIYRCTDQLLWRWAYLPRLPQRGHSHAGGTCIEPARALSKAIVVCRR
jgi:hypothetical protein